MRKDDLLTVKKLQSFTLGAIESVERTGRPLFVVSGSKPKAVIMDFDCYNIMRESLEDYLDMEELVSVAQDDFALSIPWAKLKNSVGMEDENPSTS